MQPNIQDVKRKIEQYQKEINSIKAKMNRVRSQARTMSEQAFTKAMSDLDRELKIAENGKKQVEMFWRRQVGY